MFLLPMAGVLIPYFFISLSMPPREPGEPMFRDGFTPLFIFGGGFLTGFVLWLFIILKDLWRYSEHETFKRVHIAILLLPIVLVILSLFRIL